MLMLMASLAGTAAQSDTRFAQLGQGGSVTETSWMPVTANGLQLQLDAAQTQDMQRAVVRTDKSDGAPPRRASAQSGLYSVAGFGLACLILAGIGLYRRNRG
jgi:hypothetical protein